MKQRRLAAIMFTDIAGYTALMRVDEERTYDIIRKNRQIHKKFLKRFKGRLIKEMGDGMLISFDTISSAIYCASSIQAECKRFNIPLKIGIHEGEIIFEGIDILGNGVNVAARIQEISEKGCITISESVFNNVRNLSNFKTKFIGERKLKNIDEPVKIYTVDCQVDVSEIQDIFKNQHIRVTRRRITYIFALTVTLVVIFYFFFKFFTIQRPEQIKPSIAVLPLLNLSDDPDQQYLADGMLDAITGHLSKIAGLRVIPRTSIEQYRSTKKTAQIIGEELAVSYLIEGSFQLSGKKARLIIQLINAKDESHIWYQEYDRNWKDIFVVQSEVAKDIARQVKVFINPSEAQMMEIIPTSNITAYDYYLKGVDYQHRSFNKRDNKYAFQMYQKAVELDSNFTLAWIGLASVSRMAYWHGASDNIADDLSKSILFLEKAIKLDPNLMEVKLEEGKYYYQCERNYPKALRILDNLKNDYPRNDEINFYTGTIYRRMGEFKKSFSYMNTALTINPMYWNYWLGAAETLTILSDYRGAEEYFLKVIDLNPSYGPVYGQITNLYLITGRLAKSKQFLESNKELMDLKIYNHYKYDITLFERNYKEAVNLILTQPSLMIDGQKSLSTNQYLELGIIYFILNNDSISYKYFNHAKSAMEEEMIDLMEENRPYGYLGIAYAGLGFKSKALEAGEKALGTIDKSIDAYRRFNREMDMAKILLMVGEYDEAILKLSRILEEDGRFTIELLKMDPFWDPLRNKSQYKSIISNSKYQIDLSDN